MPAAKLNLDIDQGATFYRKLTIKDSSGQPLDLSGNTFRGQIRKSATDQTILASFTFVLLNQTTNRGQVEMKMSDDVTSDLPAAKQTSAKKILREYAYDVERVDAGGNVERLLEGVVCLSPEVTR